MAPEVVGSIVSSGGSLLDSLGSQLFNVSNMERQAEISKDLMKYQWDNFASPGAQLKSYQKAGLGVNAFLGGRGSSSTPTGGMPSSAPVSLDGIADLGGIAQYISSVAQAKKAGMDTKLSEQEIKNKEIERQRSEFELDLRRQFGKDVQSAELANSYMQLVLASDTADLNDLEKALYEWKIASEKAVSQANEHNRDILKQNLDNNPTALRLENRLKELQGSAAAAAAEASHEQANVNRELRRLNSALADVEESTKFGKIESLIAEYEKNGWLSEADANDARLRASRIHSVENRRDSSSLFKAVDDFSEWLKSKVKIFGK